MMKSDQKHIEVITSKTKIDVTKLENELNKYEVNVPDHISKPPTIPRTWLEKIKNWFSSLKL